MRIVKVIIGIVLLIFSAILTLATLMSFLKSLPQIRKELAISTSGGIGYAFGCMLVIVALLFLIYFTIKKGLKLLKPKPEPIDAIDDIGL